MNWKQQWMDEVLSEIPAGGYRGRMEMELRDHLETLCQSLMESGRTRDEARAGALRAMGEPEALRGEYRAAWRRSLPGRLEAAGLCLRTWAKGLAVMFGEPVRRRRRGLHGLSSGVPGKRHQKMYMLPMSVPGMYLCKFLILTVMLFAAVVLENLALMKIGMSDLPQGTFEMGTLARFTGYSFLTSMPVLSFMVLISSRFENMWVPLGVGVAGFLSGMALAPSGAAVLMVHPFIVMFKPAVAMSARPEPPAALSALAETLLFLGLGLWTAKNRPYE